MDGPDLLSPACPFCLSSLPTLHLFSHFLPALSLSPSLSLLQLCSVGAKKMMLGKRARPQIKRTTSMTGITVDLGQVEAPAPADPQNPIKDVHAANRVEDLVAGSNGYDHRFLAAAVSPRIHRRSSGEFMEPAHFLRTCGLCERRLQPGRDIYMYRGDTAFCSLECREQQMKQDEKKEKYSAMASKKEGHRHHASASASASAAASSEGETLAAA